jgi:hypothetical protein
MLFQTTLIFAGKVSSLDKYGDQERCFTLVGSDLTHKHYTSLERLSRDKHPSLLGPSVNYTCKKVL